MSEAEKVLPSADVKLVIDDLARLLAASQVQCGIFRVENEALKEILVRDHGYGI